MAHAKSMGFCYSGASEIPPEYIFYNIRKVKSKKKRGQGSGGEAVGVGGIALLAVTNILSRILPGVCLLWVVDGLGVG